MTRRRTTRRRRARRRKILLLRVEGLLSHQTGPRGRRRRRMSPVVPLDY